jgi:hypothetical protein
MAKPSHGLYSTRCHIWILQLKAEKHSMKNQPANLPEEADIGSGEKTPGQQDTEKLIEQVGTERKQSAPPSADKRPEPVPPTK